MEEQVVSQRAWPEVLLCIFSLLFPFSFVGEVTRVEGRYGRTEK